MASEYYTLHLDNTGGRGQDRKVSMSTSTLQELPRAPYNRARLVVKHAGQVYLTTDLMTTLGMTPWQGPGLVLSGTGRKLWQLTPERLAEALEHCTYERYGQNQNPHEVMVKDRNFEALAWLEQLQHS